MNDTIMVAIVGGLCTAIPSVIATIISNNKAQALMNYKIDQLEKKVEKHNNVVERTYQLEKDMKLLKQEVHFHHPE